MPVVKPFRSIRYNHEKVLLRKVLSVVLDFYPSFYTKKMSQTQYNILNYALSHDVSFLQGAFRGLMELRVLLPDSSSAMYVESVYQKLHDNKELELHAFIGIMKLRDEEDTIHFVETPSRSLVNKQRNLLSGLQYNPSPVVFLYDSRLSAGGELYRSHMSELVETFLERSNFTSVFISDAKHLVTPLMRDEYADFVNMIVDSELFIVQGQSACVAAQEYRRAMTDKYRLHKDDILQSDYMLSAFIDVAEGDIVLKMVHRVLNSISVEDFISVATKKFNGYVESIVELATCEIGGESFHLRYGSRELIITSKIGKTYHITLKKDCGFISVEFFEAVLVALDDINVYTGLEYVAFDDLIGEYLANDYVACLFGGIGAIEVMDSVRGGREYPSFSFTVYPYLLSGALMNSVK